MAYNSVAQVKDPLCSVVWAPQIETSSANTLIAINMQLASICGAHTTLLYGARLCYMLSAFLIDK